MSSCDTNERCSSCPIEQLPAVEDRIKSGNVVCSVIRDINKVGEEYGTAISLGTLKYVVTERAMFLDADELIAPIMGATAISLAGECKPE